MEVAAPLLDLVPNIAPKMITVTRATPENIELLAISVVMYERDENDCSPKGSPCSCATATAVLI